MSSPIIDALDSLSPDELKIMAKMLKVVYAIISDDHETFDRVENHLIDIVANADADERVADVAKVIIDYNELAKRVNNDTKGRISRLN